MEEKEQKTTTKFKQRLLDKEGSVMPTPDCSLRPCQGLIALRA